MDCRIEYDPAPGAGRPQARRLQQAVDRMHAAGGGVVTVGAGCWAMTSLFLRSGVRLHLERGARLQAHTETDDYPESPSHANGKRRSPIHLIAAFDAEDVAITGDGAIDGQDVQFWDPIQRATDRLHGIFRFKPRRHPSPLVQFERCRNVTLRDFTVVASPGWTVHLFDCDVARVNGVTVYGHPYGPYTDGIGINGSRDVRVSDCHVDTGDDAIIVKSIGCGTTCRNVTVSNCVVASNCAGLGLGADVCGSIRDVVFSNCVVKKALRMMQVEMWCPGTIERTVFSGIMGRTFPDEDVENERPIYVDIQEQLRRGGTLGQVRDIVFRDVLCESRGRLVMTAQDGTRIDGVTLDNVLVSVPDVEDPAVTVPRATSLQLSNHSPDTRAVRAAVVADNIDRLTLRDVEYRWPDAAQVPMHGLCLRNVTELIDASPRLRSTDEDVERLLTL